MSEETTLSNGAEADNSDITEHFDAEKAEQAPEPETSEAATEEVEEPKTPRGVQKRLDELTREKYEERRERQRLQALLEQQQRQFDAFLRKEAPAQRTDGPPDPDDFQAGRFDPEYLEALTDWKARQAAQELFTRQRQEQERATASQRAEQTRAQIERQEREFVRKAPDYEDVKGFLLADERIASHAGIGEAILASDNPPALIYYLGKNPDLAYQIAEMNPLRAARELGRIEAGLTRPKAPSVSQAPPPVGSVPSGGTPPNTDMSKARDYKEWLAIREGQLKGRGF